MKKKDELHPENHKAYEVVSVDEKCEELQNSGFKVEISPKEYYWGYSAYLRDPDGNLLELIEAK